MTDLLPPPVLVDASVTVHRFSGPPYDQVNSYWIEGPDGVIIVDAQRLRHQASYLAAEIRASTTKPVRAIIVTHHHPDHTGGLPTLRAAFGPQVPILSTAFTREDLRTDGAGLLAARRRFFGRDFPEPRQVPTPDRALVDRERLELAGIELEVRVLEHVDTVQSAVLVASHHRFAIVGDIVVDRKTPSLRGGTSRSYLAALDELAAELHGYFLLVGHGDPGEAAPLIGATRAYISSVREGVQAILRGGRSVGPGERAELERRLVEQFDLRFDTPLFPREHEANIDAVTRELAATPR